MTVEDSTSMNIKPPRPIDSGPRMTDTRGADIYKEPVGLSMMRSAVRDDANIVIDPINARDVLDWVDALVDDVYRYRCAVAERQAADGMTIAFSDVDLDMVKVLQDRYDEWLDGMQQSLGLKVEDEE